MFENVHFQSSLRTGLKMNIFKHFTLHLVFTLHNLNVIIGQIPWEQKYTTS